MQLSVTPDELKNRLVDLFARARRSGNGKIVWFTYNFGPFSGSGHTPPLSLLSGLDVEIVCSAPRGAAANTRGLDRPVIYKRDYEAWHQLREAGYRKIVREYPSTEDREPRKLHAKAIFIWNEKTCDWPQAVIWGSFNFSTSALTKNLETFAIEENAGAVREAWRQFEPIHSASKELNGARVSSANPSEPPPGTDEYEVFLQMGSRRSHALWETWRAPSKPRGLRAYQSRAIADVTKQLVSDWKEPLDIIFKPSLSRLLRPRVVRESGWTSKKSGEGVLLHLPTAAGKTMVAQEIVRELILNNPNARVLWLAHRHLLLLGAAASLGGLDEKLAEVIWLQCNACTNHRPPPSDRRVVFCTNHYAAQKYGKTLDSFHLIVVDECHRYHQDAKALYKVIEKQRWKFGIPILGLTATPPEDGWWPKSKRVGGGDTMHDELVRDGVLAKSEWHGVERHLDVVFEDDSQSDMDLEQALVHWFRKVPVASLRQHVLSETAKLMLAYPKGLRRVLVFVASIKQAEAFIEDAAEWPGGAEARLIHSEMTSRAEIIGNIAWFAERPDAQGIQSGRRILINVEMAVEGVDVPCIDTVLFVRPTSSTVYKKQMVGRGLRGEASGGTASCLFVDFTYSFIDAKKKPAFFRGKRVQAVTGSRPGMSFSEFLAMRMTPAETKPLIVESVRAVLDSAASSFDPDSKEYATLVRMSAT